MNTLPSVTPSLRDGLGDAPDNSRRWLAGAAGVVALDRLVQGTSLTGGAALLAGRSVLLAVRDHFTAALAVIELDGVARRLVLCTPDVPREQRILLAAAAGIDAIVCDNDRADDGIDVPLRIASHGAVVAAAGIPARSCRTEWVLLTSGTTGVPRLVAHDLATLAPPAGPLGRGADAVWGTFYDIRRYGGLQILLRALTGGASLVLPGTGEPIGDALVRFGARGVTHISGTPSHWRRVLMSPDADAIDPRYIRLSGEIADQAILNALRAHYPQARISHAFASTEAGVGFDVEDGLEGFPAAFVGTYRGVEIAVRGQSVHLRSPRAARRYIGGADSIAGADGFVDTGDIVERRGDRYYFLGRRSGVINVGGLKVHPEEIEAAINRHPAVRMSVVRSRRSAITGSLVAADVVLNAPDGSPHNPAAVMREILQLCHASLPPHKVPATVRVVPALAVAPAGKLARDA
jgi:acyl-coenzyme A synthetase/AMP-(fatty) acid ligase